MFQAKHILVPVDYSDVARAAISMAVQLASHHGAKLTLVHVAKGLDQALAERIVTAPTDHVIEDTIAAEESALLDALNLEIRRAREAGVQVGELSATTIVSSGDPVESICRMVEVDRVDLIVMGTHGPQGLRARLFGSVSEQLLHKASCSVFVVKPQGYPYLRD